MVIAYTILVPNRVDNHWKEEAKSCSKLFKLKCFTNDENYYYKPQYYIWDFERWNAKTRLVQIFFP